MPTSVRRNKKGGPSLLKKADAGLAALCTLSGGGRKGLWAVEIVGRPAPRAGPKLAAEARSHDIHLRGIGAARLGLHMPHLGEIPLQPVEQGTLGAAAQHLGDEAAAGLQD